MDSEFFRSGFLAPAGTHLGEDQFWVGWGPFTREARPDASRFSIYAPDFFLKDPLPWWLFSHVECVSRADLLNQLVNYQLECLENSWSPRLQIQEIRCSPSFEQFSHRLCDLKEHFQKSDLKKAVPVVFEDFAFESNLQNRARLLCNLLQSTVSLPLYLYGVWNESEGILGATPEVLFEISENSGNQTLHTAALAGTRPRNSNRVPILEDPKEREEHAVVIEGICTSLQSFSGKLTVGETREWTLPLFSHLYTPIQLQSETGMDVEPVPFDQWVRALHPTPALGVFPKMNSEGMHWIESYETHYQRGRFGAPFGWKQKSHSICWVGIRNIQFYPSHARIGAGCGIIAASEAVREWNEIKIKIESVKNIFKIEYKAETQAKTQAEMRGPFV